MTAEVAIANTTGIALAADSAVTVTSGDSQKVINGANKLFQLCHDVPVGFMFYGNATVCGAPVESLLKSYRPVAERLEGASLTTYAECFWEFLEQGVSEFDSDVRRSATSRTVRGLVAYVAGQVEGLIHAEQINGGRKKPKRLATVAISDFDRRVKAAPSSDTITRAIVAGVSDLDNEADDLVDHYFQVYDVEAPVRARLKRAVLRALTKNISIGSDTGVVLAGYTEASIYPSLVHYRVSGFVGDTLGLSSIKTTQISAENSVGVFPFAQAEMVHGFMEGIDPELDVVMQSFMYGSLVAVRDAVIDRARRGLSTAQAEDLVEFASDLPELLLDNFEREIAKVRFARYAEPVLDALQFMPKDHLGEAAEALVNLTSFRRHVTLDPETVGGDIDVALISPGDGFVWMKRKHYFNSDLNPGFFTRYQ